MTGEGTVRHKILNSETLVPVGIIGAMIVPLIIVTWWAAIMFSGFTNRLASLERAVGTADRWTYQMEKQSWKEFAQRNPSAQVPDVKQIKEDWTTQ